MKYFCNVLVASLVLCIVISAVGGTIHRNLRDEQNDPTQPTDVKPNAPDPTTAKPNDGPKITPTVKSDSGNKTSTSGSGYPSLFNPRNSPEVVKRMLYVLLAVTAIVIVYFVFRAVRLRRRRSKSKKYGVLTSAGADMEMAPLDQDDEEDDMTVFDVNNTR